MKKEESSDLLKIMFERRSVKKYNPIAVSEEQLNLILKAGFNAPSAVDFHPRHFIVVNDREILDEMATLDGNLDKLLSGASLLILVCADKQVQPNLEFLYEDCAVSMENMLLASFSLGLGGVWVSLPTQKHRYPYVRKKFSLPEDIIPVAGIAIGEPAEEKEPLDRFDRSKVHYNGFF